MNTLSPIRKCALTSERGLGFQQPGPYNREAFDIEACNRIVDTKSPIDLPIWSGDNRQMLGRSARRCPGSRGGGGHIPISQEGSDPMYVYSIPAMCPSCARTLRRSPRKLCRLKDRRASRAVGHWAPFLAQLTSPGPPTHYHQNKMPEHRGSRDADYCAGSDGHGIRTKTFVPPWVHMRFRRDRNHSRYISILTDFDSHSCAAASFVIGLPVLRPWIYSMLVV